MVKVVSFNNVEIPEFMRVTGISFPVLPSINYRETSVPRRFGNVDNGVDFEGKPITISVTLVENTAINLHDMADKIKDWVTGNNWKPSPLTFAEQPGKYLLARVVNAVDIEDLFVYGTAEIEFYAADPTKYNVGETTVSSVGNSATVAYSGREVAPTVITVTIVADCTNLTLRHSQSTNEIKLLGTFKKGQVVTLNSDKKIIKVNDTVAMNLIDFTSKWINLQKGNNSFILSTGTAGVTNSFVIKYRQAD